MEVERQERVLGGTHALLGLPYTAQERGRDVPLRTLSAHLMTPQIETARIRLEPWQSDDWRALHAIASEPEVMRYITGGAPWNETQTQEFVARQQRHFSERAYCLWKLVVKSADASSETVDGLCGIQPLIETGEIEIGWWLAQRHWGHGIATEAARAAARDAFERDGLDRRRPQRKWPLTPHHGKNRHVVRARPNPSQHPRSPLQHDKIPLAHNLVVPFARGIGNKSERSSYRFRDL